MAASDSSALPWWLRAYLLFSMAIVLYVGARGFLAPEQVPIPVQSSPLNARFTAALYLSAAVALLLAALVRQRGDARIWVVGCGLFVTLISGVTVYHWAELTANWYAAQFWVGLYALDLALSATLIPAALALFAGYRPGRHGLTPLFLVEGALLAALGTLLLLAPGAAATMWPWALPPLLARIYSCFFLAYAAGALLAAGESRPVSIRIFTTASLTLVLLVLAASLLHLPRFRTDATTWVWLAALAAGALAFGWALIGRLPRRSTAVTARPETR